MKLRIVTLGLTLLLFNAGYSLAEDSTNANKTTAQEDTTNAPKFCLICGPEEETEALSVSYKYKGKKYSFCSMDCLKAFKKDPEKFIKEMNKETSQSDPS